MTVCPNPIIRTLAQCRRLAELAVGADHAAQARELVMAEMVR